MWVILTVGVWLFLLGCLGLFCITVVLFLVSVLFEGFSQRW